MSEQILFNTSPDKSNNLTSGRVLARNTICNLVGQIAPLLVALFAIPLLIKGLGTARFGVLTLAWVVVGYFSLFDLGLGRALTKLVAEKLGAERAEDIPGLICTALALMGMLGIIGALAAASISPWLVHNILKIPRALQDETLKAFYLLALSIPVVISATGLRGVLEAHQRFDLTNIVRIPLGMFTFLGPLIVLLFSNSLFPVVAVLVAGRFLTCGVFLVLCLRLIPVLRHNIRPQRTMVWPLISFGSWMTVTNIVGPLMVYLDRFLIGALISVAAVAYYATPYEVVTKLWFISGAVAGVLFPAFSSTLAQDQDRTARLFGRGINYIFLVLFPLVLVIVTLAHEGMTLWLGVEFADNSVFVLQWLIVGVFINSIAQIPFALVQGAGRPDLTAKMHLIELPFYLWTLWWLLGVYGIKGAAIAWVVRVGIDTLILFVMAQWLLPNTKALIRDSLLRIIIAVCIFIVAGYITGLFLKGLFLIGVLTVFIVVTWLWLLVPEERELLKDFFRLRMTKKG
ncbi:MAG: flippase [Syntrophobacterales bacterium]|nr:flippase [Syntrophobacterales bacterium]